MIDPPPRYRFNTPKDDYSTYRTGEKHPHRHNDLQRSLDGGATWEDIGYVEIHTHKVKIDETDLEDVSVGVTVRVNPKVSE